MSLSSKIQNFQKSEWYPFQGSMEFVSANKVKVTPDATQSDVFVLMDESSINSDFIRPILSAPTTNSTIPQFEFQIKKGVNVELHYKNLTHAFKLDPVNERNFYIDTDKDEIVFLDRTSPDGPPYDQCAAWVVLAGLHGCCHTHNSPGAIYGLVDCGANWHIEHCCDHLLGQELELAEV